MEELPAMTKDFPLNREDAEEVYDSLSDDERTRLDDAFDGDFLAAVDNEDDRLEQLMVHADTGPKRVELPDHIETSKQNVEQARHDDDIDTMLDSFDFDDTDDVEGTE